MGNYDELLPYYDKMTECCLEAYRSSAIIDAVKLADDMMDLEGLPMHCPPHHYLMPAVLLTLCHKAEGDDIQSLLADLEEAKKRSLNVLGGFCGFYGNCGSAVGVGIFTSVFYKVTPLSQQGWAKANRATGECLMAISSVDGPRCCKRNTYLALLTAIERLRAENEIPLPKPQKPVCHYMERNSECKGKNCPFFPVKGVLDRG